MLTEERYASILKILEDKRAVAVPELTKLLDASESTVRRDLTALHQSGKLIKVYGGATSIDAGYTTKEEDVAARQDLHKEDKAAIARAAAEMIGKNDFVYLDAGTTTELMIDRLASPGAVFVTNGVYHAARLAERGYKAIILSGRIKASTAAVVGAEAIECLRRYNFTKGFFGTNGIGVKAGFSTPDSGEGLIKGEALSRCKEAYVLADASKFNKISPITFAPIARAAILTTALEDLRYRDYTNIIEVSKS